MSEAKPKTILRSQYRVPDYLIDEVELAFELGETETIVEARLQVRRRADRSGDDGQGVPPLVLDGQGLETRLVEIDGRTLAASEYRESEGELAIDGPPARFELRTIVAIHPETNTAISGL